MRNVADIPGDFDDETRLAILAAADRDPQAPALDDEARAAQAKLIDECRYSLGDDRADAVFGSARRAPRAEITQRAIGSLRSLIEAEAAAAAATAS